MTYTHRLQWGNPFTEPPAGPDGQPLARVQLVVESQDKRTPTEILERWRVLGGPGCGFAICIGVELSTPDPRRQWSPQRKATVRRRNLKRRLDRKAPLFADQFYEEELRRRERYFAGGDPELILLHVLQTD